MQLVDLPALVAKRRGGWYNQTLCRVNDSVVRLGVMQGEYHWHKHDKDDEFFFVLSGRFVIDLENRTVELDDQQVSSCPKGWSIARAHPNGQSCSWWKRLPSHRPAMPNLSLRRSIN